jgi:hypothetical protein
MNDDEPLNLSALDPARDAARWAAIVAATHRRAVGALEERARDDDPIQLIAGWQRPLLAAAAAALVALIPAEIVLERREVEVERVERLVQISRLPTDGDQPTGADFRRALGGRGP